MYKQICVLEGNENKDTDSLSSRELLSNVATVASLVKYDYQIAKTHFIQQLRKKGIYFLSIAIQKIKTIYNHKCSKIVFFNTTIFFFLNKDASKKNCFPMLLDIILFDAVISKVYLQTRPGKTPEEISK